MAAISERMSERFTPLMLLGVLKGLGLKARLSPGFRNNIYQDTGNGREPWNARIIFQTRDNSVVYHLIIEDGKIRSGKGPIPDADVSFKLRDINCLKKMLTGSPDSNMEMLLRNDLVFEGNLSVVTRLSFVLDRLQGKAPPPENPRHKFLYEAKLPPPQKPLPMQKTDEVKHLEDPAFSDWTIEDFPRLQEFLADFFTTRPQISTERPRLLTEFFKKHGFEKAPDGDELDPGLRQARAYKHLMENRKPIIRKNDLIAGTTTDKDIGVVMYPDLGGIFIWPELYTVHHRKLNPYLISQEDRDLLNYEVLPFWMDRNMREVARKNAGNPESMRLDERFVLYFQWKAHALSHTIPDFQTVLEKGLDSILEDAAEREKSADGDARRFYEAVRLTLEGVLAYADNLSMQAEKDAAAETDPHRKAELENLARICKKVPARPAETLEEAVNSMWTTWVACHMENTNAGLSIGRVDKWLQPYFLADMEKCADGEARDKMIKRAVELVGCFFMPSLWAASLCAVRTIFPRWPISATIFSAARARTRPSPWAAFWKTGRTR